MKRTIFLIIVSLALATTSASAYELIAFWHFNSVTEAGVLEQINGLGTSAAKLGYGKDAGAATVAKLSAWNDASDPSKGNLYGTNGGASNQNFGANGSGETSNWPSVVPNPVSGYSLQIVGSNNNSRSFIVELDDAIKDCVLSYATRRGSSNYFTTQTIDWSTDNGVTWTNAGNGSALSDTSWNTVSITLGDVFAKTSGSEKNLIRVALSGASGDTGYNRFDNVRVDGTIVPEPMTMIFLAFSSLCLLAPGKMHRNKKGSR